MSFPWGWPGLSPSIVAAFAPVRSVFGRTGAIVAALGDYAASKITNDSGVVGATVKDALNTLSAGGGGVPTSRTLTAGAGLTGGGDLSANRTFDVVANADGSIVVNANDVQVGVLATDAQHGARGGGTQHANVVAAGAAGFMTGADKTKLDGIGAGANVTSVFGRTGVVVAVAGDYQASQVGNNSGVSGSTVKDALDALDAQQPIIGQAERATDASVAAASGLVSILTLALPSGIASGDTVVVEYEICGAVTGGTGTTFAQLKQGATVLAYNGQTISTSGGNFTIANRRVVTLGSNSNLDLLISVNVNTVQVRPATNAYEYARIIITKLN